MRLLVVPLLVGVFVTACRDETPTGDPPKPPPPPVEEPLVCAAVPPVPLRLLTRHEYDSSVRDLLGDATGPARDFPREPLSHGLDNDATLLQVGPENVTRYFEAAESLARRVVVSGNPAMIPACEGKPASCGRDFLAGLAPRFFRRPLAADEWQVIAGLYETSLAKDGFGVAMERSLQLLLQSPQFLYRDEVGQPMPTDKGAHRLSGHQLATKLSYFLRATTPDASLIAKAGAGALDAPEGVGQVVEEMLADERGLEGLARFLALWLFLDDVENTEKDPQSYPQFSRGLASSWRESLELFVGDVLRGDPTLKALLTSRAMFVNADMGMYDPMGGKGLAAGFARLEVPAGRAGGVLAQPGFLAYKSLHNGSSPIRRGIFVLDKLMCQPPPSPPADVPIVPPEPSETKTTRERFDAHREDPTCAACHRVIDPVGFVFENYDGMGQWRTHENGQLVDASGGITDAEDPSLLGAVEGVDQLVEKLVGSRQVHDCMAREIYRYAVGRPLAKEDECWFEPIRKRFFDSGGNFKELLAAIATSPSFRTHAPLEEVP